MVIAGVIVGTLLASTTIRIPPSSRLIASGGEAAVAAYAPNGRVIQGFHKDAGLTSYHFSKVPDEFRFTVDVRDVGQDPLTVESIQIPTGTYPGMFYDGREVAKGSGKRSTIQGAQGSALPVTILHGHVQIFDIRFKMGCFELGGDPPSWLAINYLRVTYRYDGLTASTHLRVRRAEVVGPLNC